MKQQIGAQSPEQTGLFRRCHTCEEKLRALPRRECVFFFAALTRSMENVSPANFRWCKIDGISGGRNPIAICRYRFCHAGHRSGCRRMRPFQKLDFSGISTSELHGSGLVRKWKQPWPIGTAIGKKPEILSYNIFRRFLVEQGKEAYGDSRKNSFSLMSEMK